MFARTSFRHKPDKTGSVTIPNRKARIGISINIIISIGEPMHLVACHDT